MHLSAAIPGGMTPGNPRAFAQQRLQIPLPKGKIFEQNATNVPPLGGKEVCSAKLKGAYDLKDKKIIFAIIIPIRVNKIQPKKTITREMRNGR